MAQLELAIWKAKLDQKGGDNSAPHVQTNRVKIDEESAREEKRIMSGADIIIKNVLPFSFSSWDETGSTALYFHPVLVSFLYTKKEDVERSWL